MSHYNNNLWSVCHTITIIYGLYVTRIHTLITLEILQHYIITLWTITASLFINYANTLTEETLS